MTQNLARYFFDSYAFIELFDENPAYQSFAHARPTLTRLNAFEVYGAFVRKGRTDKADQWIREIWPFVVEYEADVIQTAVRFRRSKPGAAISMTDAVGYIVALKLGIPFLTGDKEFEGLPGVEYVR